LWENDIKMDSLKNWMGSQSLRVSC